MQFEDRPNITVEALLRGDVSLAQYVEQSIAISTEARTGVQLFELIIYSFARPDEQNLLDGLKETLYEKDWTDDPECFKIVTAGDSKIQVYYLHTESLGLLRDKSLSNTIKHQPTVMDRNEISLEALFDEGSHKLTRFKEESIALYISGCPAIHLFQLVIYSMTQQDEKDILSELKDVLYEKDWDEEAYQVIRSGQSKVQVYKLYTMNSGIDSLKLIRHEV
ncbi:hypothetical protein DFQ28_003562 [Apophysomyces sp. BC1034]|nr:hypothetical protein DFQ30_010716 [Apophysomyces sp. BC1015]KAG0181326.1 hypothetical protein DFQ29_008686 [Apophysomyces sp. BC1021]KAG0189306.1 hypothetical protein DFQ28_003562 [Apophysomyces sp. BC1034]